MTSTLVNLSESAAGKIVQLMVRANKQSSIVKISVNPDAPLSAKYELEFIDSAQEVNEGVIESIGGITFTADQASARLLRGTTMTYVEGMWTSGFRFENPNRFDLMSDPRARSANEIIETKVNPAVAKHGGHVSLADMRDGEVYVLFSGGCQGCGMAPVTVKSIVESLLRAELPNIRSIIDITDHGAGENPYS